MAIPPKPSTDRPVGPALRALLMGLILLGLTSGRDLLAQDDRALANPEPLQAAAIFGDGMVLQRGKPIQVWGTGPAGAPVRAKIDGEIVDSLIDAQGYWRLELPAMNAGGPHTLRIALKIEPAPEPGTELVFEDVLVGDVWLISGQSNAAMGVKGTANKEWAKKHADLPKLRLNKPGQGWQTSTAESAMRFSGVGWYFGQDLISREPGVPVGLIQRAWGGTAIDSFLSERALAADPVLRRNTLEPWAEYARVHPYLGDLLMRLPKQHRPVPRLGDLEKMSHSKAYRELIEPVAPYGIRGALWYQGESDAWGFPIATLYEAKLRALINEWRTLWAEPELPIVILQLPHYQPDFQDEPYQPDPWVIVQETQAKVARDLPNVGLAVSIDTGATNIHPGKKRFFGRRASAVARGMVMGQDVPHRGPRLRDVSTEGSTVTLRFDHAQGLTTAWDVSGEPATATVPPKVPHLGFCLAGADRVFHWADEARIEGDAVVLRSEAVGQPVAVRYAFWQAAPWSLVNAAGLPAGPFRTDTWSVDLLEAPAVADWPKALVAEWAEQAPTIDGKLDEPMWQAADAAQGFTRVHSFAEAPASTQARLAWNEETLFVAFECHSPEGHRLKAEATKRDQGKLFGDDFVELVIDGDGDIESYDRIAINPQGVIYDAQGFVGQTIYDLPLWMGAIRITRRHDPKWNGQFESAVHRGEDGQWSVELAIPRKTLNLKPQRSVRVQFVRSFADPVVSYEWTPTGRDRSTGAMMPARMMGGLKTYHSPRRLGRLIFQKPEAVDSTNR